ncbi:MAG: Xaa-Pro aminopeptidase [Planctomycetota bacterium]|nr:Xaa-Pro aminopeptidase [Planctomycetota bacterium]
MQNPEAETAEEPTVTETSLREATGDLHAARRARLMDRIGTTGAALFGANPARNRSNDTYYAYRPSSDLLYLSGFEEPEAVMLLLPGHEEHPFVLFLRERDLKLEIWDGPRVGVERAREMVGADKAFPISELEEQLPKLLAGRTKLFYALGIDEAMDGAAIRAYRKAQRLARGRAPAPMSIHEPRDVLHEMRLIKAPEEIDALRTACRVSAEGHVRGMRMTRPGMTEFELQAEIEYQFQRGGARSPGYPSIVGGGANACVLHYIENRDTLEDGQVVLVDAGAEVGWYTGDITRTWPVGGTFSGHQRMIYDLVLQAQMEAIRIIKPGLDWTEIHKTTVHVITEGLIDMGILEGPVEQAIEDKTFKKFFMHGTGHWLGIDVHDVGAYALDGKKGRPLEPGMVFTVEPGIYFHPEEEASPSDFVGIGVRIEDDVLVTEDGCEVLTSHVPKEPEEIEEIVGADL